MSPTVELVYDKDCPNVAAARANLLRAFAEVGMPARWTEWEQSSPEAPARLRGFGSPTVLVEGHDVAGAQPVEGLAACRLYDAADGRRGVPPVKQIASALARAMERSAANVAGTSRKDGRSWWTAALVLPGIVVGLLPNLTCPLCWPAYAAVLSALGLGFIGTTTYLLPLATVLLVIAVGTLGLGAWRDGRYGPFFLGLGSAGAVLVGRFVLGFDVATFGGVGLLFAASLWNTRSRHTAAVSCPRCAPAGDGATSGSAMEVSP